jgi:hypothetical protein
MKAEIRVLRSALMLGRLREKTLNALPHAHALSRGFIKDYDGRFLGLDEAKSLVSEPFDANATDGDGDGLVQEGTPFQRPAVISTAQRTTRRMARIASTIDGTPISTQDTQEFKNNAQRAVVAADGRMKDLSKVANKMFSGRRRSGEVRADILHKSMWRDFPGVRRLFKDKNDAHADLKESVIASLTDLKARAEAGTLTGKPFGRGRGTSGRQLDPRLIEHLKKRTPEQLWAELEDTALKIHEEVAKLQIQSRTPANMAAAILTGGLVGDPKNRVLRNDQKVPWVFGVLQHNGLQLTDEDKQRLKDAGLVSDGAGRGMMYESLREVLEQAMGWQSADDREGRPVYGYFATPTAPSRPEGFAEDLTDIGKELNDQSNGPNLPGYSDNSMVKLRPSVKERSGYSVGDSLRNGILPQRVNGADPIDTSLAVIHDKDFANVDRLTPAGAELQDVQNEYLINLLEYGQTGNFQDLLQHDYVEAVIPHDVTPEEIEEMIVATDFLSPSREDLTKHLPKIDEYVKSQGLSQIQYEKFQDFMQDISKQWDEIAQRGGDPNALFLQLSPQLRGVLQTLMGGELAKMGEAKGIKMTVGPSRTSSPATFEQAMGMLFGVLF